MNQRVTSLQDQEFSAIQTIFEALETLDDDARSRVIKYIISRLEIDAHVGSKLKLEPSVDEIEAQSDTGGDSEINSDFGSFAELYDSVNPITNADKALVAAYWLQACEGAESFDSQSANKELKHLGHGLPNVTAAIESLKKTKPALTLQLKKSGKSQQARKTYKITIAGVRKIKDMIANG